MTFVTAGRARLSRLIPQNAVFPHEIIPAQSEFHTIVNSLPEPKLWSVMERVVCRAETATHRLSMVASLDYIPLLRTRCSFSGNDAVWPSGVLVPLDAAQPAVMKNVDGRRTI
jgi:hypothetical protein